MVTAVVSFTLTWWAVDNTAGVENVTALAVQVSSVNPVNVVAIVAVSRTPEASLTVTVRTPADTPHQL